MPLKNTLKYFDFVLLQMNELLLLLFVAVMCTGCFNNCVDISVYYAFAMPRIKHSEVVSLA